MEYTGDEFLDSVITFGESTLILGPPGTGKTLLALRAAQRVLAAGLSVVYVDFGGCITSQLLEHVGILPGPQPLFTYLPEGDLRGQVKILLERVPAMGRGLVVLDGLEACTITEPSGELAEASSIWTYALPLIRPLLRAQNSIALLATGTRAPGTAWAFYVGRTIQLLEGGEFIYKKNRHGTLLSGELLLQDVTP